MALILWLGDDIGRQETERRAREAAKGRGRQEGDGRISCSRRGGRCEYSAAARAASRARSRCRGRRASGQAGQEAGQKSQSRGRQAFRLAAGSEEKRSEQLTVRLHPPLVGRRNKSAQKR